MYQVFKSRGAEARRYIVEDGEILFAATMRSYKDYYEEVVKGENECAIQMMSFTTAKDNILVVWVVWYDVETAERFITQIAKSGDNEQ